MSNQHFVIVRKSDTMIMENNRTHKRTYASMGRAEQGLARMIEQGQLKDNEQYDDGVCQSWYMCCELDHYNKNVKKMRTVTNLMSGKEVQEDPNTPYSCSVASDAYWQN